MNIILPLGISFYTFSAISYILDVKHGKQEPRSLLDVMVYLSFFPKLTSGPIQKSGDFFRQLDTELEVGWKSFTSGIQIFVFGMFKKIVLADRLSIFVDQVYATPKAFGSATVLLAAIAYSLQIYFDFSGYSDMAIGSAKTLGFDLPSNFNLPYLSHNVTELWKRWHISLSSWLQEYLYFSLGGNRKGKARTYMNLILTMLLGGIWDGSNWTYVIWGLMHGIALAIHKGWMELTASSSQKHSWCANAFSISVTFIFTTFCWIFFRADSLKHALEIIGRIFSFDSGLQQPYLWFFIAAIILIIGSLMAFFHTNKNVEKTRKFNVSSIEGYYPVNDLATFWGQVAFFVLCGLTLCLAYTGGSPFIYGRY
jgi:alginate O-acetyltransferase complex protein AlgI